MSAYVMLTVFLFQQGSAESKTPGKTEHVDEDPRNGAEGREAAPWPVRRGGVILALYENSLSIAFGSALPASPSCSTPPSASLSTTRTGWRTARPASTLVRYAASSRFWFESFQNWQSEFLSLAAMVVLSIFLQAARLAGVEAGRRTDVADGRMSSEAGPSPHWLRNTEATMAKYGKSASKNVESAMRRRKKGTLKSGSGRKVKSRKQAIAIGLSEAREKGAKVPPKKSSRKKSSRKKTTRKRSSAKKK